MHSWILFVALAVFGAMPLTSRAASPASPGAVARYAEQQLKDNYAADGPGAALLVARGDQVLFRGARGKASVELGVPLSVGQVFRIGSVTKQFASAGLLKLVEAGKVSLDDPLSKYIKDYPAGDKITVHQLLNHTSGVKSYTGIHGYMAGQVRQDVTTATLIDAFKGQPADFVPGEAFAYNNSGYVLVGAVIEAASGQSWHQYLEQALFKPLGLTHTGYGDDGATIAGHVRGYTLADGKVAPMALLSMTQPSAAGALVSTVDDLLRWNRALHEGKVLRPELYAQMITPTGKAKDANYGFGIEHSTLRGQDALAHGGGIFGFASYLIYLPGSDTTVAVLQNSDSTAPGKASPAVIARRVAAYAIGDPYPAATPIAVDAASLKQLEGVYRADERTAQVLRVVDGTLTRQRIGGPRGKLIPIAKDTFLYEDGFNRLQIERDGQGAVTGVRFFPQGEGEGKVTPLSREPLPAEKAEVALPRMALERFAGTYVLNGRALRVFLEGDSLRAQMQGQQAFTLAASSPSAFFVAVVDAVLEFAPEAGPAQTLTLKQGGAVLEFKRQAAP